MSLMAVLSNQLLTASQILCRTFFEWIMDVSQLPPESICALRDVSEASAHNRLSSGDIFRSSDGLRGQTVLNHPTLCSYTNIIT